MTFQNLTENLSHMWEQSLILPLAIAEHQPLCFKGILSSEEAHTVCSLKTKAKQNHFKIKGEIGGVRRPLATERQECPLLQPLIQRRYDKGIGISRRKSTPDAYILTWCKRVNKLFHMKKIETKKRISGIYGTDFVCVGGAKEGFIPQYDHLHIEHVVYVSSHKLFHGFIMRQLKSLHKDFLIVQLYCRF